MTSNTKPFVALTTLKVTNTGVGFESGTKIGIRAAVCAECYIYRKHHKASACAHSCNSNKGGKLTFMRAIITT